MMWIRITNEVRRFGGRLELDAEGKVVCVGAVLPEESGGVQDEELAWILAKYGWDIVVGAAIMMEEIQLAGLRVVLSQFTRAAQARESGKCAVCSVVAVNDAIGASVCRDCSGACDCVLELMAGVVDPARFQALVDEIKKPLLAKLN